jgi:hypothetical protein
MQVMPSIEEEGSFRSLSRRRSTTLTEVLTEAPRSVYRGLGALLSVVSGLFLLPIVSWVAQTLSAMLLFIMGLFVCKAKSKSQ